MDPDLSLVDIFSGNAYTTRTLSDAINVIPPFFQRVNDLGLFKEVPVSTTLAAVEFKNNVLNLIPSTPRGTPGVKNVTAKRDLKPLLIPRYAIEDQILPEDLQNVRQFGSMNLKTPASVMNDKLEEISKKIDITNEYMKIQALLGNVVDINNNEILNILTMFNISQPTLNVNFAATDGTLEQAYQDLTDSITLALTGDTMTHVHALCSPQYFKKLVTAPAVKSAYANYMNLQSVQLGLAGLNGTPLRDNMANGFVWQGIFFEKYIAQAPTRSAKGVETVVPFIPADEAIFFPVGSTTTFREYIAPADWMETVNTLGLKKYAKAVPDQGGRWVDILSQSNTLPFCTRPKAVYLGTHS